MQDVRGVGDETGERRMTHIHCDHMPDACCWCGIGLEPYIEAKWQEEFVPRETWRGRVELP